MEGNWRVILLTPIETDNARVRYSARAGVSQTREVTVSFRRVSSLNSVRYQTAAGRQKC